MSKENTSITPGPEEWGIRIRAATLLYVKRSILNKISCMTQSKGEMWPLDKKEAANKKCLWGVLVCDFADKHFKAVITCGHGTEGNIFK